MLVVDKAPVPVEVGPVAEAAATAGTAPAGVAGEGVT